MGGARGDGLGIMEGQGEEGQSTDSQWGPGSLIADGIQRTIVGQVRPTKPNAVQFLP